MTPDILLDSKAEARVSELASEINCEYGSLEYMPVQLLTQLHSARGILFPAVHC